MICTLYDENQKNEMGWIVMLMREMKMLTKFKSGSLKRRDHLRDLAVDWRMILNRMLKQRVRMWIGCMCLKMGTKGLPL
jgi:hypothetical protein